MKQSIKALNASFFIFQQKCEPFDCTNHKRQKKSNEQNTCNAELLRR